MSDDNVIPFAAPDDHPAAAFLDKHAPSKPVRFAAEAFDAIDIGEPPPMLIDGWLPQGGISTAYGESGAGKSFVVLDMALHVAAGRRWCGRDVRASGVVYVAAEGAVGMRKRVVAWRRHHTPPDGIPFGLVSSAVDLRAKGGRDVVDLVEAIRAASDAMTVPVRLVVIDTLARVMASGDENSFADMSAVVANLDRIAAQIGAHVMAVHHAGKDAARGARGHSSLKAAMDAEFEVTRSKNGPIVIAPTKQKDIECEGSHVFVFRSVVVGRDERGRDVTSAVVVPDDAPDGRRLAKLGDKARVALTLLARTIDEQEAVTTPADWPRDVPRDARWTSIAAWRAACDDARLSEGTSSDARRVAFARAMKELGEVGCALVDGDTVWLLDRQAAIDASIDALALAHRR